MMKNKTLLKLINKIVYDTRTCPEDIGLRNTYPECDGCVDTDKAEKCVKCFKYACLND